jgi:hypothetical protein
MPSAGEGPTAGLNREEILRAGHLTRGDAIADRRSCCSASATSTQPQPEPDQAGEDRREDEKHSQVEQPRAADMAP